MAAIDSLAKIIAAGLPEGVNRDDLTKQSREALEALFGERYHARSPRSIRAALMPSDDDNSYAGLVHHDSPNSGAYGGTSLIWFPTTGEAERPASSLLTFVCGTKGLSPDEHILGRPGHARHLRALRRYISSKFHVFVWTKHDPTNLGQPLPEIIRKQYPYFSRIFSTRYGDCIYCAIEVPHDVDKARNIVASFVDFYAWERGWMPLKSALNEVENFKNALRANLFPRVDRKQLVSLLRERRFVIVQGPPGTGKTRLALQVLKEDFNDAGMSIQFHPAVTYETFVAGISPSIHAQILRFNVSSGWLVQAIQNASEKEFVLHIDEINRADLGRVLGEAIFLLEPREISRGETRHVALPQILDDGTQKIAIPKGLYILGTMNSADRSIAILDMAVRRRFAFVTVWPDIQVVEAQGLNLATEAFARLQDIFAQYAPDDALLLMPGHSYFLADSLTELYNHLRYELLPLLNEYLQEGRLGSCDNEIRAYVDWLESEIADNGTTA